MVASFAAGFVYVVILDEMPPPGTIADADASAGHVEDLLVGYPNALGARYVYPCDLFAENPTVMDQVINGGALKWKVALGANGTFQRSHKADGAVTAFCELTAGD